MYGGAPPALQDSTYGLPPQDSTYGPPPQDPTYGPPIQDSTYGLPPQALARGVDPAAGGMGAISPSFFGGTVMPTNEMSYRFMKAVQGGDEQEVKALMQEADALSTKKAHQAKIDRMVNLAVMSGLGIASGAPGTYGDFGTQVARGILTGINYDQSQQRQDSMDDYRKDQAEAARSRAMSYADQVRTSQYNATRPKLKTKNIILPDGTPGLGIIQSDGTVTVSMGPDGRPTRPMFTPHYEKDDKGVVVRIGPEGAAAPVESLEGGDLRTPAPLAFTPGTGPNGELGTVDRRTGKFTAYPEQPLPKINLDRPVPLPVANSTLEFLLEYAKGSKLGERAARLLYGEVRANPGAFSYREFARRANVIRGLVERPPSQGDPFQAKLLQLLGVPGVEPGEAPALPSMPPPSAAPPSAALPSMPPPSAALPSMPPPSAALPSMPPPSAALPSMPPPSADSDRTRTILAPYAERAKTTDVSMESMVVALVAAGYSRQRAEAEARAFAQGQ